MVKCSNCGNEAEESPFCPVCGSKIEIKIEPVKEDTNKNTLSGRLANKLNNNKTVDNIFGKISSRNYKNLEKMDNSANRKLFEKTEPEFLEVYDSIDDDYIKAILLFEREKRNTVDGWGLIGAIETTINTPTYEMEHDDAVQFYLDIVKDIESEIAKQKELGIFDEEEFYKIKHKEYSLSKLSF